MSEVPLYGVKLGLRGLISGIGVDVFGDGGSGFTAQEFGFRVQGLI